MESCLSVFPLIHVTLFFVNTFATAAHIVKTDSILSPALYLLALLIAFILIIYSVYLIDEVNLKSKKAFFRFRLDIATGRYPESYSEVLTLLEDTISLKLTAFSVFDMNYSSILSAFANLISFTVLYIGLDI
ncbi:hypothetical protein HDE_13324 [Halotydeus destructor]|nr:hypothetical protein HDE_13324 [Halotydeus destructor]